MGRKAKLRKSRYQQVQDAVGSDGVCLYLGPEHLSEEWPDTTIRVDQSGIGEFTVQGQDITLLGHQFTLNCPEGEPQGFVGWHIVKPNQGTPINALVLTGITPGEVEILKPYQDFILQMLSGMERSGVIPSHRDLVNQLVEKGLMYAPGEQEAQQ